MMVLVKCFTIFSNGWFRFSIKLYFHTHYMPVAVDTDFLVNTSMLGWKVKSPTMIYTRHLFLGKFYILTTTSFGHK